MAELSALHGLRQGGRATILTRHLRTHAQQRAVMELIFSSMMMLFICMAIIRMRPIRSIVGRRASVGRIEASQFRGCRRLTVLAYRSSENFSARTTIIQIFPMPVWHLRGWRWLAVRVERRSEEGCMLLLAIRRVEIVPPHRLAVGHWRGSCRLGETRAHAVLWRGYYVAIKTRLVRPFRSISVIRMRLRWWLRSSRASPHVLSKVSKAGMMRRGFVTIMPVSLLLLLGWWLHGLAVRPRWRMGRMSTGLIAMH